jgi:hypothetical protein
MPYVCSCKNWNNCNFNKRLRSLRFMFTCKTWMRTLLHLQLFVGGRISYLRYFCLFAQWCLTHIVLCFCFIFLRLMNTMLPVSLDCPFLIAPSVFSSVYFRFLIQVLQVNMNLRLRNRLLKLQLFQFLQEQTYGIFGQVDNLTNIVFIRRRKIKQKHSTICVRHHCANKQK